MPSPTRGGRTWRDKMTMLKLTTLLLIMGLLSCTSTKSKPPQALYLSTWYVKQYDRGVFTLEFNYKLYEAKCKVEDVPCGRIMQLVGSCVPDSPLPQHGNTYMYFYPVTNRDTVTESASFGRTLTYFVNNVKSDTLEIISIRAKRDIEADFPPIADCRP